MTSTNLSALIPTQTGSTTATVSTLAATDVAKLKLVYYYGKPNEGFNT